MTPDPGPEINLNQGAGPQDSLDDRRGGEFQLFPNRRMGWHTSKNALSQKLEAHKAAGLPLFDLSASNPTRVSLGDWEMALHEAFARAPSIAYRPQAEGEIEARQAVARWYSDRGGWAVPVPVHPNRILLTASSSESYAFLFQAICEPGDKVLAPLPSYPLFEFLAGLNAVELGAYRLRYQGEWYVDFASLERALTPRTRAIVVVNPNNPTGGYLREAEKRQLLALCASRRLVLIADEVFDEYPLSPEQSARTSFAQPQEEAVCVSLGGLSKAAGLPQMKLGWMLLSGPERAIASLRERLLLVADTYLSVSTPVQAALPGLLAVGREIGEAIRARTRRNLSVLREAVAGAPHLTGLPVEGGWSAVLRLPAIQPDAEWAENLLTRDGVLVQPGYFYDFEEEAWLVLSLLTEEAVFLEGVRRLGAHVEAAVRTLVR